MDEDNEPAPENAQLSMPATQTVGNLVTPTICPRRANVNCRKTKGVWRLHSWPKNSEMTELSLFRMAFPEERVTDILIPETKEVIAGDDITQQEFYVYLGCYFSMSFF